ncbi:MAG: ABC transporter permease [Ardenticatenaceae bacterium]|nr:ABC transporter permease [Ardenticatenaceae bacterium]HBY96061.1 peptide ABC transporter permease [Chloroflexota bacterium]
MSKYILRRLLLAILVFLGASIIIFFLSRVVPADPVRMAVGLNADRQTVERYRHEWGLDKPVLEQYLIYMRNLFRGDLGMSLRSQQPVLNDIKLYYPATLELALVSMLLYLIVGISLGSVTGMTNNARIDAAVRALALSAYSLPPFWVGLLLQVFFYANLGILPAIGRISSTVDPPTRITGLYLVDSLATGNIPAFTSSLQHILLPSLTIVLAQAGLLVRILRVAVLDVKGKAYVTTARSKGLSEGAVYTRHILRNAILPVLTMAGIQFGWLLTGTVVVESIFGWPGLGRYAIDSIINFDYSSIMAVAMIATVVFLLLNLFVDLLYTFADPRITYST